MIWRKCLLSTCEIWAITLFEAFAATVNWELGALPSANSFSFCCLELRAVEVPAMPNNIIGFAICCHFLDQEQWASQSKVFFEGLSLWNCVEAPSHARHGLQTSGVEDDQKHHSKTQLKREVCVKSVRQSESFCFLQGIYLNSLVVFLFALSLLFSLKQNLHHFCTFLTSITPIKSRRLGIRSSKLPFPHPFLFEFKWENKQIK